MRCKACCHPARKELEAKFAQTPGAYRLLATEYGLSAAGLWRHMHRHVEVPKPEPKAFAPEVPRRADLAKPAEGPDEFTMQRYREDLARFRDFSPPASKMIWPSPIGPRWKNGVVFRDFFGGNRK